MRIGTCLLPPWSARAFVTFLASALAAVQAGAAETGPEDLKQQADRWIELERRIADERNQWRTDKEILETSVRVLQREQAALRTKIDANDLAASLFQTRLEQAQGELANFEAGHQTLLAGCDELELRLRTLLARLPEPLQEKVAPQWERLRRRSVDEPASVADRTQALVAILAAVDQFNNSLTLIHQLRPDASGETLDIRVLYWGLAAGYAIDEQGRRAWLLAPGANGWEWRDAPEQAPAIKSLIDVHGKQKNPELIVLPARVNGGAR